MTAGLMPFPEPSEAMQLALVNLALLGRGGEGASNILASGEILPRPWDITTIVDPELRRATWQWLGHFVVWLNSQHAWFSQDLTPACWHQHPSLIHQLGTLATSRYEAGESTDVAAMEEWHRYALPSYLERTREQRLSCEEKHRPWPARSANARYQQEEAGQLSSVQARSAVELQLPSFQGGQTTRNNAGDPRGNHSSI